MNKRDERKRKFNEAIVNMLYPSPLHREPSPPPPPQAQEYLETFSLDGCCESNGSSTSGDEEHESGTEKLMTRAQRKKIRKKKLKEEAIRRGRLIGPLLPPSYEAAVDPPAVRSNVPEEGSGSGGDQPGGYEPGRATTTSKKTKNRRMAKRLAKEERIASTSDNRGNDHASIPASSVDPNEAPE